MISVGDPVTSGLVQSLAHPGGNVTGNTILSPELAPKRLQLIKEIMPSASRIALLWNPDNVSNGVLLEQFRTVAPRQGLTFTAVEARTANDLDGAFAILARERPDVVLITNDPVHQSRIHKIIGFLFQQGLPLDVPEPGQCRGRRPDVLRRELSGPVPSGRILTRRRSCRAAKPADLPVQTPQRFQLVINLKTAKAIGLTISEAIQLQADEVIE